MNNKDNKIKACFFDLDDTLIAATPCHMKANIESFAHYGIDFNELWENATVDFLGMKVADIFKVLYKNAGLNDNIVSLDDLLAERNKIFLKSVAEEAEPLPGAIAAVRFAKKQNCVVAVATSGIKKYVKLALHKFDLEDAVDFTICAEEVTKGKPDPEVYNTAFNMAQQYNKLAKDECLVIEDSLNGVAAAQVAGLPICFVPFFPYKGEPKVDYKLHNLLEFPAIFSTAQTYNNSNIIFS